MSKEPDFHAASSNNRMERIESLMQAELAKLIQQKLQDPRVSLITITNIKVSRDLSFAKVYITLHDKEKIKETLKILNKAQKFLRHELAQLIKIRKMPLLHFYYDETLDQGFRISNLLNDLPNE